MDETMNMTPEDRVEYWGLVMSDFKESALSRIEYCKQNEIKLSTFDYWRKRLSDLNAFNEDDGSRFAELKLSPSDEKTACNTGGRPLIAGSRFSTEMVISVGSIALYINSSTPIELITRIITEMTGA